MEALRLGCETFASDLNPVACLILKVLLEDIPRRGSELARELREAGTRIKAQAETELADLYPKDPDGSNAIAYLWARTVRCEAPNCGAEIPLMRSMWLCRKPKRKWALRPEVVREPGSPPRVDFEIFQPASEREVESGTVSRARATCPCCRAVLPPDRVRSQLAEQKGGADTVFDEGGNRISGARMTAVVILRPARPGHRQRGRRYRLPTEGDYRAVFWAQTRVAENLTEWERNVTEGPHPVPDEPLPVIGTWVSVSNATACSSGETCLRHDRKPHCWNYGSSQHPNRQARKRSPWPSPGPATPGVHCQDGTFPVRAIKEYSLDKHSQ